MGITHNAKNEPDINGYEMKKSSTKTTLGDFSASEYAFSRKNRRKDINILNNWTEDIKLSRSDFIKTFGNPNPNLLNLNLLLSLFIYHLIVYINLSIFLRF